MANYDTTTENSSYARCGICILTALAAFDRERRK
jgi:hypothetical protein